MTWNYRVIHRVEAGEDVYAIHEVYYDENHMPKMVTESPSYPMGETMEELQEDLNLYDLAMLKPILEYESFNTAP